MWGSPLVYGSISSTYDFDLSERSLETTQVPSSSQTFCHLGSIVFGS